MKWILATVFATTLTLAIGAGHYYLWRRLLRDTQLSQKWRRGLTGALVFLGLLLPVAFVLSRVAVKPGLCPLLFGGFFWMGLLIYIVLFLAIWDGFFLFRKIYKKKSTPNTERRLFLKRAAAVSSVVGASSIGAIGLRYARLHLETPEVPVVLPRLPKQLSGFRIAVVSDIHLGPTLRGDFARRVVSATNAMKPDLIALVGDVVDGPVSVLSEEVKPLGGFKAPHGVAYVTGNHEYYSGAKEWVEFMKKLGFHVLQNRRIKVGDKHPGGKTIDVAGIFDKRADLFVPSHKQSIQKAVRGRDPERELVVLAHQPSQIFHVEPARPGLQISGHTHGGQIWPWSYVVRLAEPYLSGLYKHNKHTQVFVTRGVGYWGPPIRFLAPAEIPCLVLTPA